MINLSDITNGSIKLSEGKSPYWEGTGTFDKLIQAINSNIQIQYDAGRIVGADFAKVYLQGIESALDKAVQYSLQVQLQNKQLELLDKDLLAKDAQKALVEEQILALKSEVDIKEATSLKDLESKSKDIELKDQQLLELQYSLNHILPVQKEKIEEEVDLLQSQDASLKAKDTRDAELHAELVPKAHQEYLEAIEKTRTTIYQVDNILPAEKASIEAKTEAIIAEKALTTEKELTAKHNREYTMPIQDNLLSEELSKATADALTAVQGTTAATKNNTLLDKKIYEAEYSNVHILPEKAEETKQKANLYQRQIKGFDDDRDQRLLDTAKEIWTIAYSTNPTGALIPDSFSVTANTAVGNIFDRAINIADASSSDPAGSRFNVTPTD